MLRRLGWIAASYFLRPTFLALVGTALFLVAFVALDGQFNPRYETRYPRPFIVLNDRIISQGGKGAQGMDVPRLVVDSTATLEMVRREGRQAEVDGLNLIYLWVNMHWPNPQVDSSGRPRVIRDFKPPDEALFRVVKEFPNLRFLHATFYDNTTGTKAIAGIPHLEYLLIDGPVSVDLSWMRPLKTLRRLELKLFTPPRGLEALAELPNLETVVLQSPYGVNDDVLRALGAVPHLKLLVFDFYKGPVPSPPLTAEGFAALGRSKSLETLYVGEGSPPTDNRLLKLAQRTLPHVDVKPAVVATEQVAAILVVPVMLIATAVGLTLASQFRGPLCRLAPEFAVSHALVAGLLLSAAVLVGVLQLTARGYQPLASTIVVAALAMAVVALPDRDLQTPPREHRLRRAAANWLKLVLLLCVVGPLLVPNTADAMLRGQDPGMLALMGMVALVSLLLAAKSLWGLSKSSSTTSFLAAREGFRRRMLLQSQSGSGWMFGLTAAERRIDAWSGRRVWTWWQRVQRWRLGNAPFRSLRFMLLTLAGIAAIVPIVVWTLGNRSPAFELGGPMLISFGSMLILSAGQVATLWRARMLMLPVEALRPYSRRALQAEMAAGFVADLLPPALLLAGLEAVSINLMGDGHLNFALLPLHFSILAAVILSVTVGLCSVLVVVKRVWVGIIVVVGALYGMPFGVGMLIAMQFENPTQLIREMRPSFVLAQLWLPVVVGTGLAWLMWRRWRAMELGSRT